MVVLKERGNENIAAHRQTTGEAADVLQSWFIKAAQSGGRVVELEHAARSTFGNSSKASLRCETLQSLRFSWARSLSHTCALLAVADMRDDVSGTMNMCCHLHQRNSHVSLV